MKIGLFCLLVGFLLQIFTNWIPIASPTETQQQIQSLPEAHAIQRQNNPYADCGMYQNQSAK